jgi:ADP-ribose pyrophosphatase YjhB (NUDIX family)
VAPNQQAEPGPVIAVGAVVVDRRSRVLLVRRARPPMAGAWTLPGGRLEAGESLEGAVLRELAEETALAARVVCELGVALVSGEGYAFRIHEHLLVPLEESPAPVAGDDAEDVRWVSLGELEGLAVARAAIDVIHRGIAEAGARGLLMAPAEPT